MYIRIIILLSIYIIFINYFFADCNIIEYFNSKISNVEIYCINMKKSKDRWESIKSYGKENNILINRFEGYDGNLLNINKLQKEGYIKGNQNLEKGQIGCAYSHIKLWEKFKNINSKYFVIFEDDIYLNKNFKKELLYILQNAPKDWDIIYLGGCYVKGKITNNRFIIPTEYSYKYNLCAHGYLLNKKKLYKMIDIVKPIMVSFDVQLRNRFKNIKVYFYYKNLVNQNNNFKTTIAEKKRLDYHTRFHKNANNITIIE